MRSTERLSLRHCSTKLTKRKNAFIFCAVWQDSEWKDSWAHLNTFVSCRDEFVSFLPLPSSVINVQTVLYSWAGLPSLASTMSYFKRSIWSLERSKPTSRQVALSVHALSSLSFFQVVTVFFAALQYCLFSCSVSHCGNGPPDKCFTSCGQTAKRCTSPWQTSCKLLATSFYPYFFASLKPLADSWASAAAVANMIVGS